MKRFNGDKHAIASNDARKGRVVRGPRRRRYSKHAASLLRFFAMQRIATADQVRRWLPEVFRTDRATRMHLQTLVRARDLAVLPRQELSDANVYVVTSRGLLAASDLGVSFGSFPRNQSRLPSNHRRHEALITEFGVRIHEFQRRANEASICWQSRFGLRDESAFEKLIPDYAFLVIHEAGMIATLVEVSTGERSATRLGRKLQAYSDWSKSPASQDFLCNLYHRFGAAAPKPIFRLAFLLENRAGKDRSLMRQFLDQSLSFETEMRHRIFVATVEDFLKSDRFDALIWIRGSSVQAVMAPVRTGIARLRCTSDSLRNAERVSIVPLRGKRSRWI